MSKAKQIVMILLSVNTEAELQIMLNETHWGEATRACILEELESRKEQPA